MAKREILPITQDPNLMTCETPADYVERGWLFLSRGDFSRSTEDFSKAIELQPEDPELYYALGMAYKGTGAMSIALKSFQSCETFIPKIEDKVRANMLLRIVHGQINQINTGDWNLEKEVWKRKE